MTVAIELREFSKAGVTQARVVAALVLREMRVRFGQSQLGYLWAVAEPMAYIFILTTIFEYLGRHPSVGNNMGLFFATGILPFTLFRNLGNQLAGAFNANRALMTYPIVQPVDTVLARAALEIATALFISTAVLIVLIIGTGAPFPNNVVRMGEAFILLSLFGFGIGLLSAVLIEHLPSWQNTFRIIMMPMLFISGVFYSLESVPPNVREILTWNPVLHGVELFRAGYYPNFRATGLDPAYLAWCGLTVTLVAFAAERIFRRLDSA